MKVVVTEIEGIKIQQVLLDMLHEYNAGFTNPDYSLENLVTTTGEKIANIFEKES